MHLTSQRLIQSSLLAAATNPVGIPASFPPQGFGGGNAHVKLEGNIVGVSYV